MNFFTIGNQLYFVSEKMINRRPFDYAKQVIIFWLNSKCIMGNKEIIIPEDLINLLAMTYVYHLEHFYRSKMLKELSTIYLKADTKDVDHCYFVNGIRWITRNIYRENEHERFGCRMVILKMLRLIRESKRSKFLKL